MHCRRLACGWKLTSADLLVLPTPPALWLFLSFFWKKRNNHGKRGTHGTNQNRRKIRKRNVSFLKVSFAYFEKFLHLRVPVGPGMSAGTLAIFVRDFLLQQ